MLTCDYVTGRLDWNTAETGVPHVIREVKEKPVIKKKKLKQALAAELTNSEVPVKTRAADIDDLVASMEAKANLPENPMSGSGALRRSPMRAPKIAGSVEEAEYAREKSVTPNWTTSSPSRKNIRSVKRLIPADTSAPRPLDELDQIQRRWEMTQPKEKPLKVPKEIKTTNGSRTGKVTRKRI